MLIRLTLIWPGAFRGRLVKGTSASLVEANAGWSVSRIYGRTTEGRYASCTLFISAVAN
jgi:hypothetical protein